MTWPGAVMSLLRKPHDCDQRALNADTVGRNYGVDIEHRGAGASATHS